MKIGLLLAAVFLSVTAVASEDCSRFKSQGDVALGAVQALVGLSGAAAARFDVQPTGSTGEKAKLEISTFVVAAKTFTPKTKIARNVASFIKLPEPDGLSENMHQRGGVVKGPRLLRQ